MSIVFVNSHIPKVKMGFSTKEQGFGWGKYAKFNMASHVGDEVKVVNKNRDFFYTTIGTSNVKWLNQQHTNVVSYFDNYIDEPCDAIYTDKAKQVCVAMSADCLPILLYSKKADKVAAVHAGWRGLANGVLEKTLDKFPGEDIVAFLGPCILREHFEVGRDVYDSIVSKNECYSLAFQHKGDRFLFDMKLVARSILESYGCADIIDSKLCTYTDERFYSYRREGVTGRMASFIWFEE